MKTKNLLLFFPIVAAVCGTSAFANWQYSGEYTYNPGYYDNGMRTVVSLRAGATYLMSKMHNDFVSVVSEYCVNYDTGEVVAASGGSCDGYDGFDYAGSGEFKSLGIDKKLSDFAFAAGASVGITLPDSPQWRFELGWDHFSEIDYNTSPLFKGDMKLTGGDTINVESGAVQSTVSSDIISVMAFYDFFSGYIKPLHTIIPYIGVGFGYANSRTVLNLSDPWSDLSLSEDLTNFGEANDNGVIQFYQSKTDTNNIAAVGALGLSYGLTDNLFMDFGARVAFIPKIKYSLTNADETRKLDTFSAKSALYTNVMLGLRFEF